MACKLSKFHMPSFLLFNSRRRNPYAVKRHTSLAAAGSVQLQRSTRHVAIAKHNVPPVRLSYGVVQVSPVLMFWKAPFPAEIWIQIIKDYSGRAEWLALSQTCWLFTQISKACLYEKVELFWSDPSFSLFVRSFEGHSELRTSLRDLTISGTERGDARGYFTAHGGAAIVSTLEQFPSLQTLRMRHFHINGDLCYALHHHSRLRALEFWSCTLDDSLAYAHLHDFSGSHISEVKLVLPSGSPSTLEALWPVLMPVRLRSLRLFGPLSGAILANIVKLGKSRSLEKLTVWPLPSSIVPFLTSSPQLRHLSIGVDVGHFVHHIPSSLPADAIPLLEHYDGPAELSELFIRNRPVHSIRLVFIRNTGITANLDILDSLQLSSVPIVDLDLWTTKMGPWLWHVPITIHHLKFNYWNFCGHDERAIIEWLPALSRLTDLQTIYLTGYWHKRQIVQELKQEDLTQISEACPSLRELVVVDRAQWIMLKPKVWECFQRS